MPLRALLRNLSVRSPRECCNTASHSDPFRPYPIGCLQPLFPVSGTEEASRSGSLTLLQRSGLVTAFPVQLGLIGFPTSPFL
jgi:hypothetical protein